MPGPTNDNTPNEKRATSTTLWLGLPNVSLPDRNAAIAGLLDVVNELNRKAGGEDLEIGEIEELHDSYGNLKKITLHGDIRCPDLIQTVFEDLDE